MTDLEPTGFCWNCGLKAPKGLAFCGPRCLLKYEGKERREYMKRLVRPSYLNTKATREADKIILDRIQ